MTGASDDEKFGRLLEALGPYLERVVIVGGWAHRLFRHHSLAQPVPYLPLMTRDTDVAIPSGMKADESTLRQRLLMRGFIEQFLGDDRPPVTHYQLGGDDAGFYVEFLTPLAGGEFRRDGRRDVTTSVAGVSAQKLRYLDVLLIAPWNVNVDVEGRPTKVVIANPVSYIVQKLLISTRRKPEERAKDILYVHDTFDLLGRSLPELQHVWDADVRQALGRRLEGRVRETAQRLSTTVSDDTREAARMAVGRVLSADGIVEVCATGFAGILS